ncbi:hypothetical protein FRC11_004909 [Ceratobasidium sp. 423]|nr:hypothetical protein FRC11_004909 [Ceratobasidium sp. 423]
MERFGRAARARWDLAKCALLKDLLKQQDEVTGRQESQHAILEDLWTRPPPTVVYQAPEINELVEHRMALTKIESTLGDSVDRFEVVRGSISSTTLTRSSTLTSSSETTPPPTTNPLSHPQSYYTDGVVTGIGTSEYKRRIPLPSVAGGLPPSEVSESEASVPPPTETTQLPMIPVLLPHMRRHHVRSAGPSINFERTISRADTSSPSPSSSSISSSRVREEVSETIIPRFRKQIPQSPELPEPSHTSAEELGQGIDFEQKLREICKRKEPSVTRPPPTEEQSTEAGWALEPGTTIVPPSQVFGDQPSQHQQPPLHPHPDHIVPTEEVLGRPLTQPPLLKTRAACRPRKSIEL